MSSGGNIDKPILRLSWGNITGAVEAIIDQMLEANYRPKKIVCVANGGYIPAAMIAYRLNITDFRVLKAKSYHGQEQKDLEIDWSAFTVKDMLDLNDSYTLIVDDIIDTGATIKAITERLVFARVSAIVTPNPEVIPNQYIGIRSNPKHWIEFPWEMPLSTVG